METLQEVRKYWYNFYRACDDMGLYQFADDLPEKILIIGENLDLFRKKYEEGFQKIILLPSVEIQKRYLFKLLYESTSKISKNFTKEQHLQEYTGFKADGWFSNFFPNEIEILDRPRPPYLLLVKDNQFGETIPDVHNNNKLREWLNKRKETGFTLPEYLIFQREYAKCHHGEGKHLDEDKEISILNSQTPYISFEDHSGHWVIDVKWNKVSQKLSLGCGSDLKWFYRSAVVIPLTLDFLE
ncbi:MAG: hypothetical protein V1770_06045 [bacterium]